jgi:hypothetical protein
MGASAVRSSTSFPPQAVRPPPPAQGRLQKAAIVAAMMMEETMRADDPRTLALTKIELCDLVAKVANDIPKLVEGTQECVNALTSLRDISP